MPPQSGADGSQTNSGFTGGQAYSDSEGGYGGMTDSISRKGRVIKEEITKDVIDQKASVTLKRILADKNIQRKIDNSPVVKQMRQEALNFFIERAREVAKFQSVNDFKRLFGSEFDKVYNELASKVEEKDRSSLDENLIPELKLQYAKVIINYLNNLKKQSPSSAQEIDHAIVQIGKNQ
jgi:hypothetical protein